MPLIIGLWIENLYENKFIQTVMLNGSAIFLNCKEIRYKSVKFRYYSPQSD